MAHATSGGGVGEARDAGLEAAYERILRLTEREGPRAMRSRILVGCDVMTLSTVLALAVTGDHPALPREVEAFIEECTRIIEGAGYPGCAAMIRLPAKLREAPKAEVERIYYDVLRRMGIDPLD